MKNKFYRFQPLSWFQENAYYAGVSYWRSEYDFNEYQRSVEQNEGLLQETNTNYINKRDIRDVSLVYSYEQIQNDFYGQKVLWGLQKIQKEKEPEYFL